MVVVLRHKQVSRGFYSRWSHWKFSFSSSFPTNYGPGVYSSCSRNEYQDYFLESKGGRCVRLTLPPSCAECLETSQASASRPGPDRVWMSSPLTRTFASTRSLLHFNRSHPVVFLISTKCFITSQHNINILV